MIGQTVAKRITTGPSLERAQRERPDPAARHVHIHAARHSVFACFLASTSASTTGDGASFYDRYAPLLDGLWSQVDLDGSGDLSLSEFISANEKLGIPATVYTMHSSSYSVLFNDLSGRPSPNAVG